jgi:ceramide glucosyltransferase
VCFLDDDVAPRPQALRELIPYLDLPGAGAAFGLACYTNWGGFWSSAMSGFVNANALLSYIPATYLTEPFTITGHCFALRRAIFDAIGGLEDMAGRVDDDHELARRLRRRGLRSIQTPMIYDVDNDLPTLQAYLAQMRRWFVFPRLLMAPYLSPRERVATALGGVGTLLPSLIALLALWSRSWPALRGVAIMLGAFVGVYLAGERRYLGRTMPARGLAALLVAALVAPLQIVWGLLAGDEVQWRGQRLRIRRDGVAEVLE